MNIPEGFCQVNFKFTGLAAPEGAEVTLGLALEGVAPTPDNVAVDAGQAWVNNILANQVDDITLQSVLCKFGPNSTGNFQEIPVGSAGGSSSSGWTPQVSVLVTKQTTAGGRIGRGRMYVPGYPENIVEANGVLDSGAVTSIQGDFDAFLTELVGEDLPPVLLHGDSTFAVPFNITSFVVNTKVATQRRRQR